MCYAEVILPLRLAWCPVYRVRDELRDSLKPGDRVRVPMGGKSVDGVVARTGVEAPIDPGRIQELEGLSEGLPAITPQELELWDFIADYYLCTPGEVLKSAYPAGRVRSEKAASNARKRALKKQKELPAEETVASPACEYAKSGPLPKPSAPLLVKGSPASRYELYRSLAAGQLAEGRSVMLFVPEISLTGSLEARLREDFGERLLVFHSKETPVERRRISDRVREGGPLIIVGTRSAIFLPFRDLSLIIVDEEQDRSYKQESPAPRYNARDCASILARIHGASLVLGARYPSLESLYNCARGRFTLRELPQDQVRTSERLRIIDTVAEKRKRGMNGQFSIKLIEEIRDALEAGRKVYLIRLWGDLAPTIEETRALFPDVTVGQDDSPITVSTLALTRNLVFEEGSLVAMLSADPIFGARDFRSDERALQLLGRYLDNCPNGRFIIQTGRSQHPLFQSLAEDRDPSPTLLEDRRAFGYPPYSRITDIIFRDPSPARSGKLSRELAASLGSLASSSNGLRIEGPFPGAEAETVIRVLISRGPQLADAKRELERSVSAFESEKKYRGFIRIDVDPE